MGLINTIFTKFHETLRVPFISPWEERTPRRLTTWPRCFQRAEGISAAYSQGRYKFIWMTKWGPISRSLTRDLTESRRESFHLHVYGGTVFYCPTKVCGATTQGSGDGGGGVEGRMGRDIEKHLLSSDTRQTSSWLQAYCQRCPTDQANSIETASDCRRRAICVSLNVPL